MRRGLLLGFGRDRVLVNRDRFRIGRIGDADVLLRHPLVSRRHALFTRTQDGWALSDEQSTAGIELDGRRLDGRPAPLAVGSTFGIGDFAVTVLALDAEIGDDQLVGPYRRSVRIASAASTCWIDLEISAPTASNEKLAGFDDDLARDAIRCTGGVFEHPTALAAIAAARRICTRAWPDTGGEPVSIHRREFAVDAHALAELSRDSAEARAAKAWLLLDDRPFHLIEPWSALAGLWCVRALSEGRLEPPPEMIEAARAHGDDLLVWLSNNAFAQLVRVREPIAVTWHYNDTESERIELPAALPSRASGTRAEVGQHGWIKLTVA